MDSWLLKCWRRRCKEAWSHSRELGHWWDRKLVRHIRVTISRPMSIWIWKCCTIAHRVLGGSSRLLLIFAPHHMPISRHLWSASTQKMRRIQHWIDCMPGNLQLHRPAGIYIYLYFHQQPCLMVTGRPTKMAAKRLVKAATRPPLFTTWLCKWAAKQQIWNEKYIIKIKNFGKH